MARVHKQVKSTVGDNVQERTSATKNLTRGRQSQKQSNNEVWHQGRDKRDSSKLENQSLKSTLESQAWNSSYVARRKGQAEN